MLNWELPPNSLPGVPKWQAINYLLDHYYPADALIRAVEFGRLRGTNIEGPCGRNGDGWSTWQLAMNERIGVLYSIDIDPATEHACHEIIDDHWIGKVVFLDSVYRVHGPIQFALIDVDDDPESNLRCLQSVVPHMDDSCIVAVDDFMFRSKPKLIWERLHDCTEARVIGDLLVLKPHANSGWRARLAERAQPG